MYYKVDIVPKNSFKFNDSIIRNLVLAVKKVSSDPSALLVQTKEDNEKDSYQEAREAANKAEEEEAKEASKQKVEKAAENIEEIKEENK